MRAEISSALQEQAKQLLLAKVNESTIQQYLVEAAAEKLADLVDSYDLKNKISEEMKRQTLSQIQPAVAKILAEKEFQKEFRDLMVTAVREAFQEAARITKSRIITQVTGDRR